MAEKVTSTSKFGEFWLRPHDIDLFQTFQTLFQSFMFQTVSVRIHVRSLLAVIWAAGVTRPGTAVGGGAAPSDRSACGWSFSMP